MKVSFDESTWSQVEEYLKVAQLCGGTANDLYSFAKGVAQRTVASLGSEREVSEAEAEHVRNILLALRENAVEAAFGFSQAVQQMETLLDQFEPETGGKSGRRRRRSRVPKV